MVQINLLPVAPKKKGKFKLELKIKPGPVILVLGALIALIIVIWTALGIQLSLRQRKLTQMGKQLASVKSTLQKLDKLKEDNESLLRKLEFLDKQLKRKVLWAQNLNRLGNLIPRGIWLKTVFLHTKTGGDLYSYEKLDINGSAIFFQDKEGIDWIGEFMSALKEDEVFAEQFSEITLVSSQRSKRGEIETMDFKLICQFR